VSIGQHQVNAIQTLSAALNWLAGAQVPDTEKRDLRSAAETACRWFKKTADEVPADPAVLRRFFRQVPAGAVGVSKKRRANVKWGVGRLLHLAGIGTRSVHKSLLAPRWEHLVGSISDPYARVLMSRFARFCSARQIEAESVSDAVMAAFLVSLEQEMRVADPRKAHRESIRLWNRSATSNPAWPRHMLTLPSYTRTYTLSWAAFPASLVEDVERYLSKQATVDVFDLSAPIKALKPSSIDTYRDRLRRFASCLVLSGVDPSSLRSLSDLVQREAIERGLRYLAQERGRKPLAGAVAAALANVARDLGRTEQEVVLISGLAGRLRGGRTSLAPKVSERLAPLKHEGNLARLFLLPIGLIRRLTRKSSPTTKDAQLFQRALALALLTVCPLRVGSLCSLRMDRHFNWSGGAMRGDLIIEFPEGELKNDEPASLPIPSEVANLIRTYWTRFRPLQAPKGSPFLFCGREPDRPKSKEGLSTQLTRLVFDRLGLRVNPHLYRHIVHLVVLRKFPGAYAMVARVLTHRSITTTIQNYSHFDGELSMEAYQHLVQGITGKSGRGREDMPAIGAIAYAVDREDRSHARR
jgi:integrase